MRQLFYLIIFMKAKTVLEIGTHIGASTINIAAALSAANPKVGSRLVTVDVQDVNSEKNKPWLN